MKITEVAEKYELSKDTLRYYEKIGLLPPVPRNNAGIREYDENACMWIEFIRCMRGAGLSIEALIEYVTLFQKGESTINERKALLIEQRKILEEKAKDIVDTIERLDRKIDYYDKGLIK